MTPIPALKRLSDPLGVPMTAAAASIPHSPVPISGPSPTPDELAAIYAEGKRRRKVFKDLKILGSGSEGTVKLAVNTSTGERVALKVMRKPSLPNAPKAPKVIARALGDSYEQALQARGKMEREIRKRFYAMKAHSGHPHLPRYLEMFETDSKLWVMAHGTREIPLN